ncbi:hypothetical protein [uncultured Draconibacterium sp.]
MPELTNKPTLDDFQKYVTELEHERNFIQQTTIDKCLFTGRRSGRTF